MVNLYIFNESSRGAVYGIGTYIRELTAALNNSEINISVVHLYSDKPNMEIIYLDNVQHWYFPSPLILSFDKKRQNKMYYRNVLYLMQLYINDTYKLVFHLNYIHSHFLADELRQVFNCITILVVHYFDWDFTVFDNLKWLNSTLKERKTSNFGELLKKTIDQEKRYFSKFDRLVCLSNKMYEIICEEYGIDSSKIFVISNGLTDIEKTMIDQKYLRKKWNIPIREKIILFVGRLDEVKGLSYLIKAFRNVLLIYPRSRLVIAGDGEFSKYTKESKELCSKIT